MSITTIFSMAGTFGLAATIFVFYAIIPEQRRATMTNHVMIFLHDLFTFKKLWIESIFKFFYVLSTLVTFIGGFFMLFWVEEVYHYGGLYGDSYYTSEWRGYYGLLTMILGPVVIRIIYELLLMAILLVKNVMDINKKLDDKKVTPAEKKTFEKEDNT